MLKKSNTGMETRGNQIYAEVQKDAHELTTLPRVANYSDMALLRVANYHYDMALLRHGELLRVANYHMGDKKWACASAPGPNERLPFIDTIYHETKDSSLYLSHFPERTTM